MHWVKRRIMAYEKEDPHHTEREHVIFFRLRSDGTMWYQVSRRSMAGMLHRIPGGWLHAKFEKFLTEETTAAPVTEPEFDGWFEFEMGRHLGVEVEDLWD